MKTIRFVAMAVLALAVATAAWAQAAPAAGVVDYDTFMKQDFEGRIRAFNQVTPRNGAAHFGKNREGVRIPFGDLLTILNTAAALMIGAER